MSRRNARKAQNAASLIRPSAVVILCSICGAYGQRVYDFEQNHIADYCGDHAAQHGYCRRCGSQLTETERRAMGPLFGSGLCGACAGPRRDASAPFYVGFDNDDELDDYYGDDE